MPPRESIDAFGAVALVGFALLMGLNQVAIKIVGDGLQPVFAAGLRSLGAMICIWLWMRFRGLPLKVAPGTVKAGLAIGALFAIEFLCLFIALDINNVTRVSVLMYSMPVWLTLIGHWVLPGERMSLSKAVGLALAFAGVIVAFASRGSDLVTGSFWGDLLALGAAISWAGIGLLAKASALKTVRPEMQLMWQVAVSAAVLLALAPFFGPLVRDLAPIHVGSLLFQIVVIVSAGYIFWLWLLSIYPAGGVSSFAFLMPLSGFGFGWLLLDEPLSASLWLSLGLLLVGLVLINRPRRAR
ncbi:puative integral membrane protein [Dinoroseobacter shibae DFL 12 = DSM 16493]|jgi:drug/metabolite transporter (DMT)-like permease|uniref:Puative integral membrane protein n=1 Tax=Dinoroseobacter shibae (strain DSM 16493 / NCIMB 14021 / DFL 12) TaxID=398580 RepID=A8LQK8_DINSH|nr:DMT family transporter [Dinoroseobacter shibae]ABV93875.1 puative integral membrane protein [Dinoroseobacter shibae DFL 12 = DSM 16493]URF45325.1 DMT family transporter [Dinoroseobacter shibae]URF49630.1 DMT family transporter [Dinoroseobacter shibae]